MHQLATYLPQDRVRALARGETLPDRTSGAALFADISGFTPLTEQLTRELGPRRGIEALTQQINAVYDALIGEIERYGGSVLSFAGDAITCWFDGDHGLHAVSAARALQTAMHAFPALGLKSVVTSGPARRLVVGDPAIYLLDTLAGATIARLATAEHLAARGEVLVDEATASALAEAATLAAWRIAEDGTRYAPVEALMHAALPVATPAPAVLSPERLRAWVVPAVFEREAAGHGAFLAELRPCVALFVRFEGIDYAADDAQAQLDAFVRHAQTAATRHAGTLLQIILGDKGSYLYIVFGALTMHEDDARRAAFTALELGTTARTLPFLSAVQMGISQGVMRVGTYGGATRRTYGALGDDVNTAARLMQAAPANEILLDGKLATALSAEFDLDPRTALALKGKADPLPVLALSGVRVRRALHLAEPVYRQPLIGRQVELTLLHEKLTQALVKHGQLLGLVAEAGMGKSRLAAEVLRVARSMGYALYGGMAVPAEQQSAYYLWKPVWRALFELDAQASLPTQVQHLAARLQALAPQRIEALPLLCAICDVPLADNAFTAALAPKDRKTALEALLCECLQAQANAEPLLIVLEDLHWSDTLSQDLLTRVAYAISALPVCIVLTYRPTHTPWARFAHFTSVALNELTPEEGEAFIQAKFVAPLPPALVAQLAAKAQGNPFYLEELLNDLHDRRIDLHALQTLDGIALPDSLHALVLSRIDRLNETQKVTLKVASVIGRLFPVKWLHEYFPELGTAARVRADLDALAQLDLTPLDTPDPELAYLFKHLITQEAAYESLPFTQRAQLHERLAHYLEAALSASPPLDLLAYHYTRAENIAKQREYLRKAGDAAQAAYANSAACDYYRRLLPLLEEAPARVEVHLRLGAALELSGEWTEADTHYHAGLVAAGPSDASARARCLHARGALARQRGDYPVALTWFKQACDDWRINQDAAGLSYTLAEIGMAYFNTADYDQAQTWLEQALPLAQQAGARAVEAQIKQGLGMVAGYQSRHAIAQPLYEASLAMRRAIGDKRGEASVLRFLGLAAIYHTGDYAAARHFYEQSMALYQLLGDKHGIARSYSDLATVVSETGDAVAYAQELCLKSLDILRELGDKNGIGGLLHHLGELAEELGDYSGAQARYTESIAYAREVGNKARIADDLMSMGLVALGVGDPRAAYTYFAESLPLAVTIHYQWIISYNFTGLAGVALQRDDLVRAVRLLSYAEARLSQQQSLMARYVRRHYDRILAAVRAALSAEACATGWAAGAGMSLDEAVAYALPEHS